MPQLDTTYILLIYLWTWFTLFLMMKKIKNLLIIKAPKHTTMKTTTPNLPWM